MPPLDFSRPKPVLMIDCRCEKRRPSLLSPDNAFREMMTSGAAYESSSFCGRLLGTLPSSGSVELAATAAAIDSETDAWSSPGKFGFDPLPCHLVAMRARFREKTGCRH